MADGAELQVSVASGVASVEAAAWDRLTTDAPPFVEHAFLSSLEDSGCVGPGTGEIRAAYSGVAALHGRDHRRQGESTLWAGNELL